MKDDNKVKIILDDRYSLSFNKDSEEFFGIDRNGEGNITLKENTELNLENVKKVCNFYTLLDRHLRSNFRDITDEQKEAIFKFFEKANDYLLNEVAEQDIQKYLSDKIFFYKKDNRYDCFEAKNYNKEKEFEIYFNKYPRWFSCFGGLNFDYDYYTKDIDGKNKKYYKISETSNTPTLVSTRNNNGWIVKDGWIDSIRGFFSDLYKTTKSIVIKQTTYPNNKLEQSNLLEIDSCFFPQDEKEESKKEEEESKKEEEESKKEEEENTKKEEIGQKNNNRWIDSFYDFFGGLNCCNCKNIESEINNDEEVEQYI